MDLFAQLDKKLPAKDYYIHYCETMLSILLQVAKNHLTGSSRDVDWLIAKIKEIKKFISIVLNKLNLVPKTFKNELGDLVIIVPNSVILEKALDIVNDETIEHYLIEYKATRTRGNLKRKEELLKLVANYIENITKNKQLKAFNHRLYSDADFLYNNLDLRHGVIAKDKTFFELTFNEREKWLDFLFEECLLVILSKNEANIHVEVEKLKREKL